MEGLISQFNSEYIIFRDKKYQRQYFLDAIDNVARYINENNDSNSPFVAFTAYNHIKTIILFYAIIKAGKIAVIIDPVYQSFQLADVIQETEPGMIVFMNEDEEIFDYDLEFITRKPDPAFVIGSDISDVKVIAFTNAEDGYFKGAMLTEQNLLSNIKACMYLDQITNKNSFCALVPYSHLIGMVFGMVLPIYAGCNIMLTKPDVLKLDKILQAIKRYKITDVYSVPSVFYFMSRIKDIRHYLEFVKSCVSGGAKLNENIYNSFYNATGKIVREGYGLTETAPVITFKVRDDQHNALSIGGVVPGSSVKIVNEAGEECKVGEVGEICVKGDNVFKGYLNREAANQIAFKDDWFYTGDYGRIDHNGLVYFEGLKKSMINVAGNNVYPKALMRYMSLNENVENIVISSQNSKIQGSIVSADIILKDSSEKAQQDYQAWCRSNIASNILPKIWNFKA